MSEKKLRENIMPMWLKMRIKETTLSKKGIWGHRLFATRSFFYSYFICGHQGDAAPTSALGIVRLPQGKFSTASRMKHPALAFCFLVELLSVVWISAGLVLHSHAQTFLNDWGKHETQMLIELKAASLFSGAEFPLFLLGFLSKTTSATLS